MTTYFITRHLNALQWASEQNTHYDVHLVHLNASEKLKAGDTIIGTLPIQLVADLNARSIHYIHLSMQVPVHLRGIELTIQQLRDCKIQLEKFHVSRSPFPLDSQNEPPLAYQSR